MYFHFLKNLIELTLPKHSLGFEGSKIYVNIIVFVQTKYSLDIFFITLVYIY